LGFGVFYLVCLAALAVVLCCGTRRTAVLDVVVVAAVLAVLVILLVRDKVDVLEAQLAQQLRRVRLDLDERAECRLLARGAAIHADVGREL